SREWTIRERDSAVRRGRESDSVDAVVDLRDARRGDFDRSPQIIGEVLRQRDILGDERAVKAPDALIRSIGSVEVADVAPVFAMHAGGHPGAPGGNARFQ